jgi:hypothetical protein
LQIASLGVSLPTGSTPCARDALGVLTGAARHLVIDWFFRGLTLPRLLTEDKTFLRFLVALFLLGISASFKTAVMLLNVSSSSKVFANQSENVMEAISAECRSVSGERDIRQIGARPNYSLNVSMYVGSGADQRAGGADSLEDQPPADC